MLKRRKKRSQASQAIGQATRKEQYDALNTTVDGWNIILYRYRRYIDYDNSAESGMLLFISYCTTCIKELKRYLKTISILLCA